MSLRSQKVLAWWTAAFATVYFVALAFFFHMFPLVPATWSPAEIAHFYQVHSLQIRIGAALGALCGGFIIPLMVVFAAQIFRLENGQRDLDSDQRGKAPVWTWLTLAGGGVTAVPLALPMILWGVAAYAPTRPPEVTAVIHELAMLLFITGSQFYIFPWVAMTVASFLPKSVPHSPFPRWFGYFNILITVTFEFGVPPFLTRTGVWAWNGLLAWWTPLTTLGIWFVVVYVLLFKAINAQMGEDKLLIPPQIQAAQQ